MQTPVWWLHYEHEQEINQEDLFEPGSHQLPSQVRDLLGRLRGSGQNSLWAYFLLRLHWGSSSSHQEMSALLEQVSPRPQVLKRSHSFQPHRRPSNRMLTPRLLLDRLLLRPQKAPKILHLQTHLLQTSRLLSNQRRFPDPHGDPILRWRLRQHHHDILINLTISPHLQFYYQWPRVSYAPSAKNYKPKRWNFRSKNIHDTVIGISARTCRIFWRRRMRRRKWRSGNWRRRQSPRRSYSKQWSRRMPLSLLRSVRSRRKLRSMDRLQGSFRIWSRSIEWWKRLARRRNSKKQHWCSSWMQLS